MSQLRQRKGLVLWTSPAFDYLQAGVEIKRDLSGLLHDFVEGGEPPTLDSGALGNLTWKFDGTSHYLEDPDLPLKTYLGSTGFTAVISLRVDAATEDAANPQDDHGLLCSSVANPNGGGLYVRNFAGDLQVILRSRLRVAAMTVVPEQWYVVLAIRQGGRLKIGPDPFSLTDIKAGGGDNYGVTPKLRIGLNHDDKFFEGQIGDVLIFRPPIIDLPAAMAWAFVADRVLATRGDPELQLRDLITRRAIVSEHLAYGVGTFPDSWGFNVGQELALTHRNILLHTGQQSGLDQSLRYEARVIGRDLDVDNQSVLLGTQERERIIVYSSLRADRVGADEDGLLQTGCRLHHIVGKGPLVYDSVGKNIVPLDTGVAKMNPSGWHIEQGGLPKNTVFVDVIATPWSLAGGAVRQALPKDVAILFDSRVKVGKKVPRCLKVPTGATATLSLATFPCFLRFYWLGTGTIEITAASGRTWSWDTDEWIDQDPDPLTLSLGPETTWQEFVFGPVPKQTETSIVAVFRGAGGTFLRVGYASGDQNLAIVATDNTPAADFAGQGDHDDVGRIWAPMPSAFASEGAIRFRFAPRWGQNRWNLAVDDPEEDNNNIAIMRVNRGLTGEQSPAFTIYLTPGTSRLNLLDFDSLTVISYFNILTPWEAEQRHLIVVAWSIAGVPGILEANEIKIFVDGEQPAVIGAFPSAFTGDAPMVLSMDIHASVADQMPNGYYSDVLLTSRVIDAMAEKVLIVEEP